MRRTRILIVAALLFGCAEAPQQPAAPRTNPVGTRVAAAPEPSPTPTPPTRVSLDFEAEADGGAPAQFIDVTTEATWPAWVYPGNWYIETEAAGNRVYLHDDMRAAPGVSFRRYKGDAFGADGALPPVYHSEVLMHLRGSQYNYPPTGDQGVQFFYQDPGRYLEVVVKPNLLEIWEADGAEPKSMKGWKRLWYRTFATTAGDRRRIGALVDRPAGTFTAYLDGVELATVPSAILGGDRPGGLALRGIGNLVSFDNVVIEAR